jgi:hypothetical protein
MLLVQTTATTDFGDVGRGEVIVKYIGDFDGGGGGEYGNGGRGGGKEGAGRGMGGVRWVHVRGR